jgi:ArsR family transcriptional regulator
MEQMFRALGERNRLRIVLILERGPLSVGEITWVVGLSQSNASHHLKLLSDAGVVLRRGEKGWVFYGINWNDPLVAAIVRIAAGERASLSCSRPDMRRLSVMYRERRNRSIEFFGALGQQWNQIRESLPPPSVYMDTLTRLLGTRETLLEVGVGTGHMIPLLARHAQSVLGVDNSPEMLAAAEKSATAQGLSNRVEFRLGEAEHLPLGDGSVDGVLMHFMLHHAGNPRDAVKEASRVLNASGSLVLAEFTGHTAESLRSRHGDLWPGFTPDELKQWGGEAGLSPDFEMIVEEHSMMVLSMSKGDNHEEQQRFSGG